MKEIEQINQLTQEIINSAKDVHRTLGPGLPEADYRTTLRKNLVDHGFKVEMQLPTPNAVGEADCREDFLVEDKLILEVRSLDKLTQQHQSQITSCIVHFGYEVGLLINFNVENLEQGLMRVINTELYEL
jgi:GxxExxY protein